MKWDQKIVKESEYAQAVVINAGIANACTGAEGCLLYTSLVNAAGLHADHTVLYDIRDTDAVLTAKGV